MKLASLHDLFVAELRDIYNGEKQLAKALPKLAAAASAPELRQAFEKILVETKDQVGRLEHIFESMNVPVRGRKCPAMEGLIEEGLEIVRQDGDPAVRDAGLIGQTQKIQHLEIAGYGTTCTFAQLLGLHEAAELLRHTLREETEADKELTRLAENIVNAEAIGAGA